MVDPEDLENHIRYLKESIKNREGVQQGFLIRDSLGNVVDRVGRYSLNPPWYQEFYRQYGRKPTDSDLREMAREHLLKGYWDIGGFVPPISEWKDEIS